MDSLTVDADAVARGLDVVCVGHAAFDSVYAIDRFPPEPLKVKALRFDESVGGMAANAACAVARLGGRAAFWGPLGDDRVARRISEELHAAGVDSSRAFTVEGAFSSHSAIIVDAQGERLIISHRGDALGHAGPLGDLPEARVVLIDIRWDAGALSIARRYRERGVPIVIDGEMGNATLLRELAPFADHLIFSETGYAEWAGRRSGQRIELVDLQALVERGATLAAVTCGEQGTWFAHRWGSGHLPAFEIDAVETLGAGDVFHGAYALAVATGCSNRGGRASWCPSSMAQGDLEMALTFASAAAALKCARHGGRAAMPAATEVHDMLAARSMTVRRRAG